MRDRATFSLSESSDLLRRTPALLDAWLRDLPDDWIHANEVGPWREYLHVLADRASAK